MLSKLVKFDSFQISINSLLVSAHQFSGNSKKTEYIRTETNKQKEKKKKTVRSFTFLIELFWLISKTDCLLNFLCVQTLKLSNQIHIQRRTKLIATSKKRIKKIIQPPFFTEQAVMHAKGENFLQQDCTQRREREREGKF